VSYKNKKLANILYNLFLGENFLKYVFFSRKLRFDLFIIQWIWHHWRQNRDISLSSTPLIDAFLMQLLIFTLGGNIFIPSNKPIQYNDLVRRGRSAQWDKLTDAEKDVKLDRKH
jgi:hypothetical protein